MTLRETLASLPCEEQTYVLNSPYHLGLAEEWECLASCLSDFEFVEAKALGAGIQNLSGDYQQAMAAARQAGRQGDNLIEFCELMLQATRLCITTLSADPMQLASQLHGRLIARDRQVMVRKYLTGVRPNYPWLRLLTPTLLQAGGPLVATATLEPDTRGLGVSSDCTRAVLETGNTLIVLDLITFAVISRIPLPDKGRWLAVSRNLATALSSRPQSPQNWKSVLEVWDLEQGTTTLDIKTRNLDYAFDTVCPSLSPDGTLLAFSENDPLPSGKGHLYLYDTKRCIQVSGVETSKWARIIGITTDDDVVVGVLCDGTLMAFSVREESVRSALQGRGVDKNAVITEDGRWYLGWHDVLTWPSGTNLRVVDLTTMQMKWEGSIGNTVDLTLLAVTHSGQLAFFGHKAAGAVSGNDVLVWDVFRGAKKFALTHDESVSAIVIYPDDKKCITGCHDGSIIIWDIEIGRELLKLAGPLTEINTLGGVASFTLTGDGQRLVSIHYRKIPDSPFDTRAGAVAVWRFDWGPLQPWPRHDGPVTALCADPSGRLVISVSSDWTANVWSIPGGGLLRAQKFASDINSVAISPDGNLYVIACGDFVLRVIEVESGEVKWSLINAPSKHMVFGPDSRHLFYVTKGIEVWGFEQHTRKRVVEIPGDACAFASQVVEGDVSIGWYSEGAYHLWRPAGGLRTVPLKSQQGRPRQAAFSASAGILVLDYGQSQRDLEIWDLSSGRLRGLLEGTSAIVAMGLSADGTKLSAGSHDGRIRLWRLPEGLLIAGGSLEAEITSCLLAGTPEDIIAGDVVGRVHFIACEDAAK